MRTYEQAARILTQWMEEHQLTAAEFAREVGMDAGILRSILNGKKKSISIRNLMQIARVLGVSLQQLMDMLG